MGRGGERKGAEHEPQEEANVRKGRQTWAGEREWAVVFLTFP